MLLLACAPEPEDSAASDCDPSEGGICIWAGTGDGGFYGDGLDRREAWFYWPVDIELSPWGPPVIHDWNNHKLRIVDDEDHVQTVMGTAFVGDGPDDASDNVEPGAPGTTVNLNHPTDAVYRSDGLLLCASWHTHKMRSWDPDTGLVYVWAGAGAGFSGDGGPAKEALLNQPKALVWDEAEDAIYIADMRNERIRKVDAAGDIATVAGDGSQGYAGDGGPASAATINLPTGTNPTPGGALALDGAGGLYLADTLNHVIRRIDLESGLIDTVVGTGVAGFSGDGGPARDAQLDGPVDLEIEDGVMVIADSGNHRIREVDLASMQIRTVAGDGSPDDAGEGGPATDASLNSPWGVELDGDLLYVADTFNHKIKVVGR